MSNLQNQYVLHFLHHLHGQFSGFHFFICSLQLLNEVMLFRLFAQALKHLGRNNLLTQCHCKHSSWMESRKCFDSLNHIFCYFETSKLLSVGNKPKWIISKRVFKKTKHVKFSKKTNISYPLIRTRTYAHECTNLLRYNYTTWIASVYSNQIVFKEPGNSYDDWKIWFRMRHMLEYKSYLINQFVYKIIFM